MDEIHIDVEENNEEVAPSKEDAMRSGELVSRSLESSLDAELAALPVDHFYESIIYKVSGKYRKLKEESYTPRVVSIGPLHHGKSHLQVMEAYKLRCLKYLTRKLKISLKELSEYATTMEGRVRACYQDFRFSVQEFSKMILLDGIFIILLIVQDNKYLKEVAFNSRPPFHENSWMASDAMHDLLLLENQLPLFFITELLTKLDVKAEDNHNEDTDTRDSFLKELCSHFKGVGITSRLKMKDQCKSAWHLVDFLYILHCPSNTNPPGSLDGRFEKTRSISELQEAGVIFSPLTEEELFAVSFDKSTGELKIPELRVDDTTDTFFRNLIAFEQSQEQKNITSYIIFMDSLIDTAEDVKLLVKHKIIVNMLGENQIVADLFNNLHKEVIEYQKYFYFAKICQDLNEYSKDYFHQWKSRWFKWSLILKNKYFSNPWSCCSVLAAVLVVLFTITQTGFAAITLYRDYKKK